MPSPEFLDVLTWKVGGRLFAIELSKCMQVIRNARIRPVPRSREIFCGISNVRGDVVFVADMAVVLGEPVSESGVASCLIHLRCAGGKALRVDEIDDVKRLKTSDLRPPSANLDEKFLRLLPSAFPDGERWVYLVDPDDIFD